MRKLYKKSVLPACFFSALHSQEDGLIPFGILNLYHFSKPKTEGISFNHGNNYPANHGK